MQKSTTGSPLQWGAWDCRPYQALMPFISERGRSIYRERTARSALSGATSQNQWLPDSIIAFWTAAASAPVSISVGKGMLTVEASLNPASAEGMKD